MAKTPPIPRPPDLATLAATVEEHGRILERVVDMVTKRADGRPRKSVDGRKRRYSVEQRSILPGAKLLSDPVEFDSVLAVAEHTGYSPNTVSVRLSQNGGTWCTATKRGGLFYVVRRL